jgi:hypothetical protein
MSNKGTNTTILIAGDLVQWHKKFNIKGYGLVIEVYEITSVKDENDTTLYAEIMWPTGWIWNVPIGMVQLVNVKK